MSRSNIMVEFLSFCVIYWHIVYIKFLLNFVLLLRVDFFPIYKKNLTKIVCISFTKEVLSGKLTLTLVLSKFKLRWYV